MPFFCFSFFFVYDVIKLIGSLNPGPPETRKFISAGRLNQVSGVRSVTVTAAVVSS